MIETVTFPRRIEGPFRDLKILEVGKVEKPFSFPFSQGETSIREKEIEILEFLSRREDGRFPLHIFPLI